MTVARATEISSTLPMIFDDTVSHSIERAANTLRNAKSAQVKEQDVEVITNRQVNLTGTFMLDISGDIA